MGSALVEDSDHFREAAQPPHFHHSLSPALDFEVGAGRCPVVHLVEDDLVVAGAGDATPREELRLAALSATAFLEGEPLLGADQRLAGREEEDQERHRDRE